MKDILGSFITLVDIPGFNDGLEFMRNIDSEFIERHKNSKFMQSVVLLLISPYSYIYNMYYIHIHSFHSYILIVDV